MIACEEYSSLSRLLRVTAYVLHFIRILKSRIRSVQLVPVSQTLEPEEVEEAERLWIIESQTQDRHFNEWKNQFKLFNDEKGIMRCGGRLSNAEFQYGTKHPILLSK